VGACLQAIKERHSNTPKGSPLPTPYEFHFHPSIADISAGLWNALVNANPNTASPFLRHEFLLALEQSGSACADTGWQPHHIIVTKDGRHVAAMPLYIKSHSYGEYVFDWSWADAYRQHGMRYYPKLVTSVPFTPSTGPRLLIAEGEDHAHITHAIAQAVIAEARRIGASSWHVLFPGEKESARLTSAGLRPRIACQFHWYNRGYKTFDDFLATFNSRKRKNLRKERNAVHSAGIQFTRFRGNAITPTMWQQFYRFYQNTYQIRGQQGYLTQAFFQRLSDVMPDNLLLVVATLDARPIAAALSFCDSEKLYGRYWGCLQEYQFLHFETCYYQGIEYAIEEGLQSFDSGAQGEHKIQRGFEPIITHSNHWIADPQFDVAIGEFLEREAEHIKEYKVGAEGGLPFRLRA
jgi:predicted N-acyltransferase